MGRRQEEEARGTSVGDTPDQGKPGVAEFVAAALILSSGPVHGAKGQKHDEKRGNSKNHAFYASYLFVGLEMEGHYI